jgi:hypothetical protein
MAFLSDEQWQVLVNFSGYHFAKQPSLQFEATPIAGFVTQKGMVHLLIESFLKLGEKNEALFWLESIGSQLNHKISGGEHPMIDDLHYNRVDNHRAKFFHQIQRSRRSPIKGRWNGSDKKQ